MRFWASSMIAIAALHGCTASPLDDSSYPSSPEVRPASLVRVREAAAAAPDPTPLFEGDTTLDMEKLVAAVLARNPTVTSAQHAFEAAAARPPQVSALADPMVSYSIAPGTLGNDDMEVGHEIELSQQLPWPGKLRLAGDVAHRQAAAVMQDIQQVRLELTRQAKRAFYDLYHVHRALAVNQAHHAIVEEFEQAALRAMEAGRAGKGDVLQVQMERYALELRAIELDRARRTVEARINALLHRRPRDPLPPPPEHTAIAADGLNLDALVAAAVEKRPELLALAHRIEAQKAARQLARKQFAPDFTVMGTYSSMWEDEEHRWMVGASMNLPIQVGRRRATEREALAELHRLFAELSAGVDRVSLEVSQAHDQVLEARQAADVYRTRLIPAARENLDAARSGYQTGTNDLLTLITAERNLISAELAYHEMVSEYFHRMADLERAVGGFGAAAQPSKEHRHD